MQRSNYMMKLCRYSDCGRDRGYDCFCISGEQIGLLLQRLPLLHRIFHTTIASQIAVYGAPARARLIPKFKGAGLHFPPKSVALLAIKATKELQVYAASSGPAPINMFALTLFWEPAVTLVRNCAREIIRSLKEFIVCRLNQIPRTISPFV